LPACRVGQSACCACRTAAVRHAKNRSNPIELLTTTQSRVHERGEETPLSCIPNPQMHLPYAYVLRRRSARPALFSPNKTHLVAVPSHAHPSHPQHIRILRATIRQSPSPSPQPARHSWLTRSPAPLPAISAAAIESIAHCGGRGRQAQRERKTWGCWPVCFTPWAWHHVPLSFFASRMTFCFFFVVCCCPSLPPRRPSMSRGCRHTNNNGCQHL